MGDNWLWLDAIVRQHRVDIANVQIKSLGLPITEDEVYRRLRKCDDKANAAIQLEVEGRGGGLAHSMTPIAGDKQAAAHLAEIETLYQPSITDLELDEHEGKARPVVYLNSVRALLRGDK